MNKGFSRAVCVIPLIFMSGPAGAENDGHMMGSGMMKQGPAWYNMMGYNMMYDTGCPMMMNIGAVVDHLLSNRKQLSLSQSQVAELTRLRDDYLKDIVALNADLSVQMLELDGLVNDESINLVKLKEVSERIEKIESDIRMKSIEEYAKAKMQMTNDQIIKAKDLGLFDVGMHAGPWNMME